MNQRHRFAQNHFRVTRRYFLQLGAAGLAGLNTTRLWADAVPAKSVLTEAIAQLEYLTPDSQFNTVGRGHPVPHTLSPEKRRAAGLDRDTWKLEVIPDPNSNVQVDQPLSSASGTAWDWPDENARKMGTGTARCGACLSVKIQDLAEPVPIFLTPAWDWPQLMKLAEKHSVRYLQPASHGLP